MTIETLDDHESVLATGRFSTDNAGPGAILKHVVAWPDRVWAVEGSNGAGWAVGPAGCWCYYRLAAK